MIAELAVQRPPTKFEHYHRHQSLWLIMLGYKAHLEHLCSHHTPGQRVANTIKCEEKGHQKRKYANRLRFTNENLQHLPPSLPHTSILGNLFPFFQNSKVSSTNSYEFYTTFIFKLLCASHSTLGPIYFIGKIKPCDIWWRYPKIILLNEHKYIFSFLFHMMAAFEEAKCIIQRRMAESCSPGGHIHIHPIFKSTQKQRN